MSLKTPDPWIGLMLSLAAFRVWRILAEDTILDNIRYWVVGLPQDWDETKALPKGYRLKLAEFLMCPWCLGFHVCWIGWLLWDWQSQWVEFLSFPLAMSAMVGLVANWANHLSD